MKECGTRLALQTASFLIILSVATSLRAQNTMVSLDICNKGTVPVVVLTAMKYSDLQRGLGKNSWEIDTKVIAYAKCRNVYFNMQADPVDLAFAVKDTKGQWGSGKIAQVPDFGTYSLWLKSRPVMSRGDSAISVCAPLVDTSYKLDDNPKIDCTTMRLTPVNGTQEVHGPFIPVTSVLHFEYGGDPCFDGAGVTRSVRSCNFYLNISPGGTDRELHAVQGTSGGDDADPHMTDAQLAKAFADSPIMKALAKAAADNRKKQEQAAAAAEAERKRQAYAATPQGRLEHARELQAAREQRQKQVLAADAAGNPNVKVEAQMIRREQEDNRQRWAGGPKSPAAFDPQWMGKNVAIVGTVSRVEVDPNGSPQWLTIYFKESPDATFVVCSPYPDMFQERVGLNLSVLVGKTIEAAGQVESPYCGGNAPKGSIRVVESTQWKIH